MNTLAWIYMYRQKLQSSVKKISRVNLLMHDNDIKFVPPSSCGLVLVIESKRNITEHQFYSLRLLCPRPEGIKR